MKVWPKVCRHCGAFPLTRDQKGRWVLVNRYLQDPSRFCPRRLGQAAMEHSPVPLQNRRKLEAWLDS